MTETKHLGEILKPVLNHHSNMGLNKYLGLLKLNRLRYRFMSIEKSVYHFFRVKEPIRVALTTEIEHETLRIKVLEIELAMLDEELELNNDIQPTENKKVNAPYEGSADKVLALIEFIKPQNEKK